jgi:hypothetical protein
MNSVNSSVAAQEKKFSLVMKNIDHNLHRAYKYAKDPMHGI